MQFQSQFPVIFILINLNIQLIPVSNFQLQIKFFLLIHIVLTEAVAQRCSIKIGKFLEKQL